MKCWKDAFRGLSLAGLCLMTSWIELHFLSAEAPRSISPSCRGRVDHTAAVFLTLLLAGLFLAGIRTARRAPPRSRRFCASSAIRDRWRSSPLNALRIYVAPGARLGALPSRHRGGRCRAATGVFVAALLLVLRWWRQTLGSRRQISLAMAPFALVDGACRSGVSATTGAGLDGRARRSPRGDWRNPHRPAGGLAHLRRARLRRRLCPPAERDWRCRSSIDCGERACSPRHADPAGRHTIVAMTSLIVGERLLTVDTRDGGGLLRHSRGRWTRSRRAKPRASSGGFGPTTTTPGLWGGRCPTAVPGAPT